MSFNADAQGQINNPIEIVLEGKNYVISKITLSMLTKIEKVDKRLKNGEITACEALLEQAVAILGGSIEEFENIDIRKISAVVAHVIEQTAVKEGELPNG